MGESVDISAFTYTPRQDQWEGGIILRAKFEVSRDGRSWEVVADNVAFDNVVNSRRQQVVRLPNRVDARYFRLTALQTVKDEELAWASQLSVIVDPATGSSSTK
jgi:alpha-L-fucosidase